jgi:hypothetical protein
VERYEDSNLKFPVKEFLKPGVCTAVLEFRDVNSNRSVTMQFSFQVVGSEKEPSGKSEKDPGKKPGGGKNR